MVFLSESLCGIIDRQSDREWMEPDGRGVFRSLEVCVEVTEILLLLLLSSFH